MHHAGIAQLREDQVSSIIPAITYTDTALGVTQVTITHSAQCHPGYNRIQCPVSPCKHIQRSMSPRLQSHTAVSPCNHIQHSVSPRLQSHTAVSPCNHIQRSVTQVTITYSSVTLQSHTVLSPRLQSHTAVSPYNHIP